MVFLILGVGALVVGAGALIYRKMSSKGTVKIANSTYKDVWVKVDTDRDYLKKLQVEAAGKAKEVEGSVKVTAEYEWLKQTAGYSRISSKEYLDFDVPQGKEECYVSAVDSDGNVFGDAKCFRATNGTYFNMVLCDDLVMRKGFKNKIYRCYEGLQEYYGPFACPGCGTKKCQTPVREGSDGWCKKIGN